MAWNQMTGPEMGDFSNALQNAFDLPELSQLLRYRLNKQLATYAGSGLNYPTTVSELLDGLNREGLIFQLLKVALDARPYNETLQNFGKRFDVNLEPPPTAELEGIIRKANAFINPAIWGQRLIDVQFQVCRIEFQGDAIGSGFLVGPDVVMTNYHVIEYVHKNGLGVSPNNIVCRFDYKVIKDGPTLLGATYHLAAEWLLDYSPYSSVDAQPVPKNGTPNSDELDFAMLRLEKPIGNLPVGEKSAVDAPLRGWVEISNSQKKVEPDAPLIIIQHPKGRPLKLALDSNAIIAYNGNNTRVTYRTNTEEGSSGSPCFDIEWNCVALHHSSEVTNGLLHVFKKPNYNEGIPVPAIVRLLETRGKQNLLAKH